jgi:hypothetical protein
MPSLNPVVWFVRLEQAIWALFTEVEYRLKIVPRGTPLKPSRLGRRLLRTQLAVLPLLLGSLFIPPPTRTRLLLLGILVVVLVVCLIFMLDAREGMHAPPPPPSRTAALPPRPLASRPPSPRPPVGKSRLP